MNRRRFLGATAVAGAAATLSFPHFSILGKEEQVCTLPTFVRRTAPKVTERPELWHRPQELYNHIWNEMGLTGEGVTIAILDTGYRDHMILPKPIFKRSFIKGQSVDDKHGHGKHVAGIALGRKGYGAAPNAKYMALKALSNQGRGTDIAVWEATKAAVDEGADIVNASLGGPKKSDNYLKAVEYCIKHKVFFCCASGNRGGSNTKDRMDYPGKYKLAITVGATKGPWTKQTHADFSSTGPEVDIMTCGEHIWSCADKFDQVVAWSGTSMATPNLAGHLALHIQQRRQQGAAHPKDPEKFIEKVATDAGKKGYDWTYGHGILNVEGLLQVCGYPSLLNN